MYLILYIVNLCVLLFTLRYDVIGGEFPSYQNIRWEFPGQDEQADDKFKTFMLARQRRLLYTRVCVFVAEFQGALSLHPGPSFPNSNRGPSI